MSSMLEQLWPIFLDEVSEKLDAVESMIISASNDHADIDALFREFHTLKSSFSMVDFRVLMELAHACEDVLQGLRKNSHIPDQEIRKHLLDSIDWMKQQLAMASPGQYPQQTNEALLERLAPFRTQEDDSYDNAAPAQHIETEKKYESASKKIIEEKEALAVETLRISSKNLDNLVTNISQLALKENAMSSTVKEERIISLLAQARQQLQKLQSGEKVNSDIMENLLMVFSDYRQTLLQTDLSIQASIANIQQAVLDLRIIPLSTIFNRLPRIVRQKANTAGKQVQLVIEGGEVSIDKGMVEIISEPLIHLLHNAIMHGVESTPDRLAAGKTDTSRVSIIASEQGSLLRIEVSDDGHGIDYRSIREKAIHKGFAQANDEHQDPGYWLNFLFTHGFNSENTHRTTGLDIVREQLSGIGGAIDIFSTPGSGTRFVMRMPVTVAIQSALIVSTAEQILAIPTRHLIEIIELPHNNLKIWQNQPAIDLRGNMLPVYSLSNLLDIKTKKINTLSSPMIMLLILQNESSCIALAVDDVLGRQELFLRDTHQDIRNIPGVSGISLLGNGNAVIILDCENLFRLARIKPEDTGELLC
jgi:chemotaxis protein histidine kinase CheA